MFGSDVDLAARRHARAAWPRESVGYVIDGAYAPQVNIAADRSNFFEVAADAWRDDVAAVIHSHTFLGPLPADRDGRAPGEADMVSQQSAAVPFGITATDGKIATDILWFGDHVLDAPLIGRRFVDGVTDCYELVRAWFWQERGVLLPGFPRESDWWEKGADLLAENFARAGFAPVPPESARPGDGLLMAYPATGRINHCGVLVENGLFLHHRAAQLSRREPWSPGWRRLTRRIVRHAA